MFEALRAALADELGADPAPSTAELHVHILQEGRPPPGRPESASAAGSLVGRELEFAELRRAWAAAASGHGSLILLTGVAGAGKTRLAAELARVAADLGGDVLDARCYAAENAMFVQPLVEVLTSAVHRLPPDRLRTAAAQHRETLSRLAPAFGALFEVAEPVRARADVERRRTAEAVAGVLSRLARDRPVLVVLDDLHNAGTSTIEVLHFLRTVLDASRLLVVATVRTGEGASVLATLGPISHEIAVGPLSASAVRALAVAAGQGHRASEIAQRTGGHAFFVAEILRAEDGNLPASLQSAVLARVARAGPGVEAICVRRRCSAPPSTPDMLRRWVVFLSR